MKVEEGVHLALETRRRAEEEKHVRLEAENEACLVEDASLKSEEEDAYLWIEAVEEARLAEETRLKVEEHESTWLEVEEGFHLTLTAIQRA